MPRQRKTVYRRRKPKTNYVRKVAKQEAKKAIKTKVERKMYDSVTSTTGIDYNGTGTVYSLLENQLAGTSIVQGTDDINYIGKKIVPVYLNIRGQLVRADSTNAIRVFVLQTKTNNTPTLAGILQSVGNIRAPYSPYERQFNEHWNMILDRTYTLDAAKAEMVAFNLRIPMKKMRQISFTDNAGTVEKGNLYIAFISDSSAVSHPTVEFYSRLYFTDA